MAGLKWGRAVSEEAHEPVGVTEPASAWFVIGFPGLDREDGRNRATWEETICFAERRAPTAIITGQAKI